MRKRIVSESFENRMQELFGLIQENAHKIMKLGFDESIANYLAKIDKKRGMFLADSLTQQYIKDKSISDLYGQNTKQALGSIDQSDLFDYMRSRENEITAISDWVKASQGQVDLKSFSGFNDISAAAQEAVSESGEEISFPPSIEDFLSDVDYEFGKDLGVVALKTLVSFEHPELDVNNLSLSEMLDIVDEIELLEFLKQNDNELNYIIDWMRAPVRQEEEGPLKKDFVSKGGFNNIFEMLQKSKEWHEKMESEATGKVANPLKGDIVKRYDKGYFWIDLQTNNSPEESKAMGHCGTDHRATTLFSLRSPNDDGTFSSHITIAYNKRSKNVTQVKGKGNERPSATGSAKYMKYVDDFLIGLIKRGELFTFNWSYGPDLSKKEVDELLSHMSAKHKFNRVKMGTRRLGMRGGNI